MQFPQFRTLYVSVFICLVSSLGAARLPESEVQALREIAKSLGKTDWNFGVDPCTGDSGWKTLKPVKGFENSVTCNCAFENNTVLEDLTIIFNHLEDLMISSCIFRLYELQEVEEQEEKPVSYTKLKAMQFSQFFILHVVAFVCFVSLGGAVLPDSEVQTLREIAKSLGKTNWNFGVDPCSGESGWATANPERGFENAVTCNCTHEKITVCHVVGIVLKAQNLPGILPPEAAKLSFLAELDLTRNYLNGSIPKEWGSLPLVNLSLIANRISGGIPIELTNITTLQILELVSNRLSGPLPPEIGKMTNIQRMALSSNYFSGPLPVTLARLTNLKDFRISDNQFTGKIPSFIRNWTKLERLEMQASGLQGPIPSVISVLTNLKDLRISDLNGTDADFPSLRNMNNMTNLILRSCNIIGEIPPYIEKMSLLKILDLSFNKLKGQIPNLDKDKIADIILTGNALTGPVPVPDWLITKGDTIDLSYNNFTFGSTGAGDCRQQNANLFGNSSPRYNLTRVVPCLESFHCPRDFSSFHINCGGREVIIDGVTTYDDDVDKAGPSDFYLSRNNWALSSTGGFIDNNNDVDQYIATNTTILEMNNPELYMTARLSPLSLTYYGFCLVPGNYTVSLQFAEITFTNNESYSSLGRRIFDIYIQGKLVRRDFNIEEEAGGVAKEVIKKFPAVVAGSTLEIRFYWAGKGTTVIPVRGTYGPLVSAISVKSDLENPGEDGKKISAGLVVGIVFIVLGAILLILWFLWWRGCIWRRNKPDQGSFLSLQGK